MGTNRETLLYAFPAAAAVLGGIGGWDGNHPTASVCCFAVEDSPELLPAGITDALGQMCVLDHIADPQFFQIDDIVLTQQQERRLMMEVVPLTPDFLVLLGEEQHRFPAPLAALLPPRDPPLGFLQCALGFPIVPRILHDFAFGGDEKHLQADVDARLLTGGREGLHGHICAGEAAVPAVRFMGDGDRFDRTLQRTTPLDSDPADLDEDQKPILERGPVAELLVGETIVAVGSLKAWIPGLLALLDAAKEGLKGTVQAGEHILQDLGVDIVVLRSHVLDGRQLSGLMGALDTLMALLPRVAAFLQRGIIEFPAATQHERHRLLLLGCRQELVFEGLAYSA